MRHACMIALLAPLALIAGCETPNQPTAWVDPAYTGQGFRKIFVVGLSARDLTDQRGFENLMVSALQDAGGRACTDALAVIVR